MCHAVQSAAARRDGHEPTYARVVHQYAVKLLYTCTVTCGQWSFVTVVMQVRGLLSARMVGGVYYASTAVRYGGYTHEQRGLNV
jgi:hypothetical protein